MSQPSTDTESNLVRKIIKFTGVSLIIGLIGIMADFSDAIQLLPQDKQDKILDVFRSSEDPLFITLSQDSVSILVLNFDDLVLQSDLNKCFGRAFTLLIEKVINDNNLPMEVKYYDAAVITTDEAFEIGREQNSDAVLWGNYRNEGDGCLTRRLEVNTITTVSNINSNLSGKRYNKVVSDRLISGYDVEDGFQFLDYNFLLEWLYDMANSKRILGGAENILIPSNLPDSIIIHWHLTKANTLLAERNENSYDLAIMEFEKILKIDPENRTLNLELSELYLEVDAYEKAFNFYESIIDKYSEVPMYYYHFSTLLYKEGEYDSALKTISKAILLDSTQSNFYLLKGYILDDSGEIASAIEAYNKSISLDETYYGFFYRSRLHSMNENFEKALIDINEAIKINESSYNAHEQKAWIFYNLKNWTEAKRSFDKAIEYNEKFASAYNGRALTYSMLDEKKKEITNYNLAIKFDPKNPTYFYNKGVFYQNEDMIDSSFQNYKKSIVLDPKYISAYENLAEISLNNLDYNFGIKVCESWISLDSSNAYAYNLKGIMMTRNGDLESALLNFQKAYSLDSKSPFKYYNNVSFVLSNMENYSDAKVFIDSAFMVQDSITSPYVYKNRGFINYGLGNYSQAEDDLTLAINFGISKDKFFNEQVYQIRAKSRLRNGKIISAWNDYLESKSFIFKLCIYSLILIVAIIPIYLWLKVKKKNAANNAPPSTG